MTKQVSLSATISALTMTLFALSVAVSTVHEEQAQNASNTLPFSVSAKSN